MPFSPTLWARDTGSPFRSGRVKGGAGVFRVGVGVVRSIFGVGWLG